MPNYRIQHKDTKYFISLLKKDKKSKKGKIVCILPTGKEDIIVYTIDNEERLKNLINQYGEI